MKVPLKSYNGYSVTEEQIRRYREMSIEKRLEWLYLGSHLRRAFFEMMEREPVCTETASAENSKGLRG